MSSSSRGPPGRVGSGTWSGRRWPGSESRVMQEGGGPARCPLGVALPARDVGQHPGPFMGPPLPPRLTALESPQQRRSGGDLGVVDSEPTSAGDLRLQLLPGGPPGCCLTAPRGMSMWGVSPLPRGPTWPRVQGSRP